MRAPQCPQNLFPGTPSFPQEEHHPGKPAPQSTQKRIGARCSSPHVGHVTGNRAPQSPQKRWPSGFTLPQSRQSVLSIGMTLT